MTTSNIHGVSVIISDLFEDNRGAFESIWENHKPVLADRSFKPSSTNFSYNTHKFTLRGMHYQLSPYQQSKLVTCVHGKLLDVVVDLRKKSVTYKKWTAFELTARSGKSVFIPRGCAHGFLTLEDHTTLAYLIEGKYMPEHSGVLHWRDPEIAIRWPIDNPILSEKDRLAPRLSKS